MAAILESCAAETPIVVFYYFKGQLQLTCKAKLVRSNYTKMYILGVLAHGLLLLLPVDLNKPFIVELPDVNKGENFNHPVRYPQNFKRQESFGWNRFKVDAFSSHHFNRKSRECY